MYNKLYIRKISDLFEVLISYILSFLEILVVMFNFVFNHNIKSNVPHILNEKRPSLLMEIHPSPSNSPRIKGKTNSYGRSIGGFNIKLFLGTHPCEIKSS